MKIIFLLNSIFKRFQSFINQLKTFNSSYDLTNVEYIIEQKITNSLLKRYFEDEKKHFKDYVSKAFMTSYAECAESLGYSKNRTETPGGFDANFYLPRGSKKKSNVSPINLNTCQDILLMAKNMFNRAKHVIFYFLKACVRFSELESRENNGHSIKKMY